MIKVTSTKAIPTFVNALVYGESGVGKTVLGATAPKPLILSAEKGLLSLADRDVPVIEIASRKELVEAYSFIANNKDYETLVLDSISEIGEIILAGFKVGENDPRRAYGKMADELSAITRKFRDLKKHVVFIAKIELNKDEYSGKIFYRPSVPGQSFTHAMPYMFDEVFAMQIVRVEQQEIRILQTAASAQYVAKDRSGKLENNEKPNLSHVFNKILGV